MTELASFEALWRRYAGDVRRFAVALSGDPAMADDLTAETFLRCWTARDRAGREEVASVKGYLFVIARNLYLKGLSRARRSESIAADPPDERPSPERRAAGRAELESLRGAWQRLPEADRAALAMRSFDGLAYEEIARVLGITPGAARVKVHRARLALAQNRNQRS